MPHRADVSFGWAAHGRSARDGFAASTVETGPGRDLFSLAAGGGCGRRIDVDCPPSGHVAGLIARTDRTRGVHRAPAGQSLTGAFETAAIVANSRQEVYRPLSPNVLGTLRGGICVWSGRTLVAPSFYWRYVAVRRPADYLENSVSNGLQWSVFEPNDARFWARIRERVTSFMSAAWRKGAFQGAQGAKETEALFVHCDPDTMTEADLAAGRLIVEAGFAPIEPAELVIFSISPLTGQRD